MIKYLSEYLQSYRESRLDRRLRRLAGEYHDRCEAFDSEHCVYRNARGAAVPMLSTEIVAVSRHARSVRDEIGEVAAGYGATPERWRDAILAEGERRNKGGDT